MLKLLYCAAGGALGAVLRYSTVIWTQRKFDSTFPWGTLNVNIIGSLVIGSLWGLFEILEISPALRIFLMIGMLGSFTTFSTFSLENLQLLKNNQLGFLAANILISNLGGIGSAMAGYWLAKYFLSIAR